jgi:hypothetical protein
MVKVTNHNVVPFDRETDVVEYPDGISWQMHNTPFGIYLDGLDTTGKPVATHAAGAWTHVTNGT